MRTYDAIRAFRWLLILAVMVYAALYIFFGFDSVFDNEVNGLSLFMYVKSVSYAGWLVPLIAAIPFGGTLVIDMKSGFARTALQHYGKRRYILSKLTVCAVSGGIALSGGTLIFLLLLLIIGHPMTALGDAVEYIHMLDIMIFDSSGMLYYLGVLYLQFISGAFWALTALAFSTIYADAFIATCFPLFLQRFLHLLVSKLSLPQWANLGMMGRGTAAYGYGTLLIYGTIVFGLLILLTARLFLRGFQRRVERV